MTNYSFLGNGDSDAVFELYRSYLDDPDSVDESWRQFFLGFEFSEKQFKDPASGSKPDLKNKGTQDRRRVHSDRHTDSEFKVLKLIDGYRARGHLFTRTNPVRERRKYSPTLDIANFGLTESDWETEYQAGENLGIGTQTLKKIVEHLENTYCRSIGAEYRYIRSPDRVEWLRDRMESSQNQTDFNLSQKSRILNKLNQPCHFEQFIHTKFVGQKRFSLEGAESMIPALDAIIAIGAQLGIKEFNIGMAHRGRLNILSNIMQKPYSEIFAEFEGFTNSEEADDFMGDVKYHQGYSTDIVTDNGDDVHLSLSPNPSHLEAVGPVVQGIVRAKAHQRFGGDYNKIAPILIHGDAAIAGQGVCYEVSQMSLLDAYKTGGTIHLVINNQLGFTTNYLDARSSTYCTDVAKVTLSPVFHVNGDDVEALIHAIQVAVEFRQKFNTDVYIDLLCYRRYGHNEGDEPKFTQPLLYKKIAKHPNPWTIYSDRLAAEGSIKESRIKDDAKQFKLSLEQGLTEVRDSRKAPGISTFKSGWKDFRSPESIDFESSPPSFAEAGDLKTVGDAISKVPNTFKAIKKMGRLMADRKKMIFDVKKVDWATAEALSFGMLLIKGTNIRFTGQDVQRGTFSHRHAVINQEESEETYIPLNNIREGQGKLEIFNSLLSEYAVLGFEFGFAFSNPDDLVIWEAQFGDFANGGQIIIDQFVCCSMAKWKRMNGLVILLPHGYEGQGPEHSSARFERYLQLCANNNMTVANVSTPANYFHLLQRQMIRKFRVPLVVMTPKSLLRHPQCTSSVEELTSGSFKEVIDDHAVEYKSVTRVILCTGKIYYELLSQRAATGREADVAIVRIEQLYPFPDKQLDKIVKRYVNQKEIFWVQEEPLNMGAAPFVKEWATSFKIEVISRKPSESTATGFGNQHVLQQKYILDKSFENLPS